MADITRVDTDGVRAILGIGQLAVDNYIDGGDAGRIWTGDGTVNRPIAFKDEVVSAGIESKTYDELMAITPTENTMYWFSDTGKYVYGDVASGTWKYFNDESIARQGAGTGNAGTWVESWEVENNADVYWNSTVFGNLKNGSDTGRWNRHKNSTGSQGTGPNGAYDGTWYLYAEVSNNGHTTAFDLSTANFAILKSITFRYSMYGNNCGTLTLSTISNGVEVEHFNVSGNQGQSWQEVSLDLSNTGAEEIKFLYAGATSWQADLALDKIEIVSE